MIEELLEELDALSDILTDLGDERKDTLFFGLSSRVDDLIEKYSSLKVEADKDASPQHLDSSNNCEGC